MKISRCYCKFSTCVFVLTLSISIQATGIADNASVLPTGISQGYWDFYHYHPTTQRYNFDGDREDLAYPFTNAPLDSTILDSLAPLDALVGGARRLI